MRVTCPNLCCCEAWEIRVWSCWLNLWGEEEGEALITRSLLAQPTSRGHSHWFYCVCVCVCVREGVWASAFIDGGRVVFQLISINFHRAQHPHPPDSNVHVELILCSFAESWWRENKIHLMHQVGKIGAFYWEYLAGLCPSHPVQFKIWVNFYYYCTS